MKSIFKFSLAAVIAVTVIFSSCGKYPNGPKVSLQTKMARITREWQDPACPTCPTFEYKKDGTYYWGGVLASGFTWQFSSDKKNVELTFAGPPSVTTSNAIQRLTTKDLWLLNGNIIEKYTAK